MNYEIIITEPAIDATLKIVSYNYRVSNYYYNINHILEPNEIEIVKEGFVSKLEAIKEWLKNNSSILYNMWKTNRKKATCCFCSVFNLHFYYYVEVINDSFSKIKLCYVLKPIQKTNRRHRRILHNVEEYRKGRPFCYEMLILTGELEEDDDIKKDNIITEQLRQAFAEFECDYDEANREYLAEQARLASMSDVDILIEDMCRR